MRRLDAFLHISKEKKQKQTFQQHCKLVIHCNAAIIYWNNSNVSNHLFGWQSISIFLTSATTSAKLYLFSYILGDNTSGHDTFYSKIYLHGFILLKLLLCSKCQILSDDIASTLNTKLLAFSRISCFQRY